jgi:BA14K-like protein
MRVWSGVLMTVVLALPAHADVAEYCAAYARDFADQSDKQLFNWQRRYDNAEASCVERFANDGTKPAKAKTKTKPQVAKVKAKPAPKLKEPTEAPQQQAAKAIPKLTAGSPEWTAYCKKKYVSFNEVKGTYLSRTGIERKCLITVD